MPVSVSFGRTENEGVVVESVGRFVQEWLVMRFTTVNRDLDTQCRVQPPRTSRTRTLAISSMSPSQARPVA